MFFFINKFKNIFGLAIVFFVFCNTISSQNITIKGRVIDSIGKPLSFANVIADTNEDKQIKFAISDNEGVYKLVLEKEKTYRITVSYLGFIPQTIEYNTSTNINTNIDFTLIQSSEELDEVTLSYTPPVIVKEDTISYRTDAFKTGEERKLRDILKKLPAVEVDREGNVSVQGKPVTKMLVENKEFFTGDSKLAVNNIPADAVDIIEVLDNYEEVGFLKGLEDSNEMAMNIKLKENKKRFMFGDLEIGGGIKERYLFHPSLYYYSPKTSINAIGDFNNTGLKSFTIKDYLEFEGGRNKLLKDTKSYFSLINNDFAKFLSNQEFFENQNRFGALSISKSIGDNFNLSSYGIWSVMINETKTQSLNDYIISDDNFIEYRENIGSLDNEFGIGKLKLKFEPNNTANVTFTSYFKASENHSLENVNTNTEDESNNINTLIKAHNLSLEQNIQWYKQFSRKHIISSIFNYNYLKATPNTKWVSDNSILDGIIPIVDEDIFDVRKLKTSRSQNINFVLKNYWVLNKFNHIYFTIGTQLFFDDFLTSEYQVLSNGNNNDFSSFGYGNNVRLNLFDLSLGMHYKTQIGKLTLKPGIFYHYYDWSIKQNDEGFKNAKIVLMPELNADFKFSSTKSLNFKYNLKTRFASVSQLANRFSLIDFNSVFIGNEQLENELYHYFKARYYKFSLPKDVFYNINVSYRFKEDNFKNETIIQGIDYFSSPVLSDFVDKVWNLGWNFEKGIGKYKFFVNGNINKAKYEKPINNELIINTSNSYSFSGGLRSRFESFPNFEMSYLKSISDYQSISKTNFNTDVFTVHLEYDFLEKFILNADYSFESYENESNNVKSNFDVANISLFYQKENSPWGVELIVNNIFDIRFRRRNSFSSILVSDEKSYVLPRILMLKLNYKL